ncbi:mxaL protein [Trinickia symbiotica]|uniref:VWA domain-containing protein n=1 Tax=Trinickia symbiotica TaxID=863227 RepID=UPI000380930D|nr:VWA domain-containing protein [Trinickia symbiotica]PPK47449.1 mxaL protein [Trinickia symbiotica]
MKLGGLARALLGGRNWAVGAAFALLALALAFPRVELPRDTFDYIVTFDITQSMYTEDVSVAGAPLSRLAFAKSAMREALGTLPCGSRVGWSVFTGQNTLLLVPPIEVCRSYDALLVSLDAIDGRMRWTNWSRIAEGGVYSAVRVARTVGRNVDVVFVTDGQEAPPISPSNAPSPDIALPGVTGWLIGVGGDQPAPIPRTDANGNRIGYWSASEVIQVPPAPGAPASSSSGSDASRATAETHEELSELRGEYLSALAERIGFGYRRLVDAGSLAASLRDARFAHRTRVPTDVRWVPALAALLLLAWRYSGGLRRRRAATLDSGNTPGPATAGQVRDGLSFVRSHSEIDGA